VRPRACEPVFPRAMGRRSRAPHRVTRYCGAQRESPLAMEARRWATITHCRARHGNVDPSGDISARRERWAWLAAVLLFGAAQILISALRFDHLQADTLDLGFQSQMLWLISHGHWYGFSSVFQTPA
jgi:hypothetical protein